MAGCTPGVKLYCILTAAFVITELHFIQNEEISLNVYNVIKIIDPLPAQLKDIILMQF